MKKVSQIQGVVMGSLAFVQAHVLQSTIVALSSEPDDPAYDKTVKRNTFIAGAVMTKGQYFQFRALCNLGGVWVRQTNWKFGEAHGSSTHEDDKFEYSITTTEMYTPGVFGAVTIGLTVGLLIARRYGLA